MNQADTIKLKTKIIACPFCLLTALLKLKWLAQIYFYKKCNNANTKLIKRNHFYNKLHLLPVIIVSLRALFMRSIAFSLVGAQTISYLREQSCENI